MLLLSGNKSNKKCLVGHNLFVHVKAGEDLFTIKFSAE